MSDDERRSWTLTAIGMTLVVATALVTGLVVASWTRGESAGPGASASVPRPAPAAARTPAGGDVEACNAYARAEAHDPTVEVGAGGVGGTRYGLDESQSRDARYVEVYRDCMKRRGFTG